MRTNIDLTDNRDFDRGKDSINHTGTVTKVLKTSDNFISRMYTSNFVNYLQDNLGKLCDRCGKYDYFGLMKYYLCESCDHLMEEEYREEYFLTGNREMIEIKKRRKNKAQIIESGLWWK